METPLYVKALFAVAVLLTVYLFYKATGKSRITLTIVLVVMVFQSALSLAGFYKISHTTPPRFILLVLPAQVGIIGLLISKRGRRFADSFSLKWLTTLHIVRVPVDLVLLMLFEEDMVPRLLTLDGVNFDILSGISAPVIYYLVFIRKSHGRRTLLGWNIVTLLLLVNVIVHGVLSVPTQMQQIAFSEPNVALLVFPFSLLAACIVPLLVLAHISALRQLSGKKHAETKTVAW